MAVSILEPGVLGAKEGAYVSLLKLGVRFLVSAEQTGGRFSVVEHPLPARSLGAPVHTHAREDEITYVADGIVSVQLGDQVYEAGPGATIFKPRGIPHAFWNASDRPARMSEIITPAGFEQYFVEMAAVLAASEGGRPDPVRMKPIWDKYGLTMDLGSIQVLARSYGLLP